MYKNLITCLPACLPTHLPKMYRFWTFQRRFERLNNSFSRHQKAHWRHIVRFQIIDKKFFDEVDSGEIQTTHHKLKMFQFSLFLDILRSFPWKSKLLLNQVPNFDFVSRLCFSWSHPPRFFLVFMHRSYLGGVDSSPSPPTHIFNYFTNHGM